MKKEAKRKKVVKGSAAENHIWRWILGIVLIAMIAVAGVFYIKKIRTAPLDVSALSASFEQLSSWVTEHRSRLNQKIVNVQQMTASNAQEPVHFEFYSELPKMTMPVPKSEEKTS